MPTREEITASILNAPMQVPNKKTTIGASSIGMSMLNNKFAKLDSLRHKFDITKEITPTEYVGGLFPRGHVSAIIAPSGTGKTIIEQRLFTDLSKGGKILDGFAYEDKPRNSIVIAGEFGEDALIERTHDFDFFDADKNFVEVIDVFNMAQEGISFMLGDKEGHENIEHVAQSRPDIMFFDSFGTLFKGRENNNDELFEVFRFLMLIAKKYNIAIVVIHHSRKRLASEQNKPLQQDDMIGGNAIARCVHEIVAIEYNYEHEVNVVRCLKSWREYFKSFTYKIKKNISYGKSYLVFDLNPDWLKKTGTFIGKAEKSQSLNFDLYEQIKMFLRGRGTEGASTKEIANAIDKTPEEIKSPLNLLKRRGEIKNPKYGLYTLTESNLPIKEEEVKTPEQINPEIDPPSLPDEDNTLKSENKTETKQNERHNNLEHISKNVLPQKTNKNTETYIQGALNGKQLELPF